MFVTAIIFVAILSILVFVHELGHFTMARIIGVRVEEFGFGLPPRIWGKRMGKHKTIYSVNWLPIGGFVKLAGEDESENLHPKLKHPKEYFFARSKKERAIILLAGVTMNFLLAVGITSYLLTQGVAEASGQVHIESVAPDGPAAKAGLKPQDIITLVDGVAVHVPQDVITMVKNRAGQSVTLTMVRAGVQFTVTLTPRTTYPKGEGPTGVAISDLVTHTYPWYQAPIEATKINLVRAWEMIAGIGVLFVRIFHLQPVGEDVAGPIGIAAVTGTAVKFGWKAVLEFMSILSLNLAVLNVLPIPALDGGRLAFVFLEKILGRKVKPAFEQKTHSIGMIILFILILLISINDILRLAHGG